MAIAGSDERFHDEIWALADFLMDPIRIIGVQEIFGVRPRWPQLTWAADGTKNATLRELFLSKDLADVKELDFHDPRAELQWDLNEPIPPEWYSSAHTLIDIGSIEHIANTNQVLENYLRMTMLGGLIAIQTPVKGYHGHGLYTFSPEVLIETLKKNGCELIYLKYCTDGGTEVQVTMNEETGTWKFPDDPYILIWIVARKFKKTTDFVTIQQRYYQQEAQ